MGDSIRYPNMGTVAKSRRNLRAFPGLYQATVQAEENPLCERRAPLAGESRQSGPVL